MVLLCFTGFDQTMNLLIASHSKLFDIIVEQFYQYKNLTYLVLF